MTLEELIKQHDDTFSAYYSGELYTHTPMALTALKELGAPVDKLESFYDNSVAKLSAKTHAKIDINLSNWQIYLGQHQYEAAYAHFFELELKRLGKHELIQSFFDLLIPGVGAAAFHPMIRLFYAMRSNNDQEIVLSLATWAASYLDLRINDKLLDQMSAKEVLKNFSDQNFNNGEVIPGNNIAQRMQAVSKMPLFKKLSLMVKEDDLRQENLEEVLLWLFSQSDSFTMLHAVTSHQAFEDLKQFSNDPKRARILMWKSLLAAYLSTTGSMTIDFNWEYPKRPAPEWHDLIKHTLKSNDEHDIKLVHVLSIKKNKKLDEQLRYAAAVQLNLV